MGMPVTPKATPFSADHHLEVSSTTSSNNNNSSTSTSGEVAGCGDTKEVSLTNVVEKTTPETNSPTLTVNPNLSDQDVNAFRPHPSTQSSLRQSDRPNSAPPHELQYFSDVVSEAMRRECHQRSDGHAWRMLGDQLAFEMDIRRALSNGYLDRYQHDKTNR